MMLLQLCIFKN